MAAPFTLSTSEIQFKADPSAQALIKEFEQGSTPKKLAFINSTQNNRIARLNYEFESQGDILNGEFGYSILCRFLDPEDHAEFVRIEQEAANFLPKDIEFKSMLRKEEDRIFIKLQTKNGRFVPRLDPPVQLDNLEKSTIHQGSLLDIDFQPNVWINFEQRMAGIYLKVSSITIDGGKKKQSKRR